MDLYKELGQLEFDPLNEEQRLLDEQEARAEEERLREAAEEKQKEERTRQETEAQTKEDERTVA